MDWSYFDADSVALTDLECKAKKRKRLAKRRDLYLKVGLWEVIRDSLLTGDSEIINWTINARLSRMAE